jgi:outer membrane protein OmpA-like peptidoglycan-associated protein
MNRYGLIFGICCLLLQLPGRCQDSSKLRSFDNVLPRWCIDINGKTGVSGTQLSGFNLSGYPAYIKNNSVFNLSENNAGSAVGGDVSIGYFWGKKKQFGIGAGISFVQQNAIFGIDSFHVEYKSIDVWKDTFRQIINANNMAAQGADISHPGRFSETVTSQSYSVPICLKYKHQFTGKFGVSADLGGVINFRMYNTYSTSAVLDYEALYAYNTGNGKYYYDNTTNAPQLANNYTWLITQNNVRYDTIGYFGNKKNQGYNVAYQQQPFSKTGVVQYAIPGFGFLIQANACYQINYRIMLLLGGFFTQQYFSSGNTGNWKLTDRVGEYNSVLNSASNTNVTNYGLNFGLRYFFGGSKDIDGDGVADIKDDCAHIAGPGGDFHGCPDFDGDGIPDKDDACPLERGPFCTNGCPDRDNDCIADKVDKCPDEWGYLSYKGCYSDPKIKAVTPKQINNEDAVSDGDTTIVENFADSLGHFVDAVAPLQTVYLPMGGLDKYSPYKVLKTSKAYFELGKNTLNAQGYENLNEAIEILKKEPDLILLVAGHTDDLGSEEFNMLLSFKRAESIQKYCAGKGIDEKRVILSGYGKKYPEVTGTSAAARSKNRRIELRIMLPISK